jgi:DNA-binding Xre family transcriptional regulator
MNLTKWKQFSKAVDRHNGKIIEEAFRFGTLEKICDALSSKIEKTLINFYEWQVGKLKL